MGDGCGLDRAMWEVGDGADMWAQAIKGREKGEGAAAAVPPELGWPRKETGGGGEGEGGERAGGGKLGQ